MEVMSMRRALTIVITVAALLALMLAATYISGYDARFNDAKPLTREAVYIGGATITALAVFGTTLGTGIMTGQGKKLDESELRLVYFGAAIIVTMQGLNMLFACCLPFSVILLGAFTLITIVGAVMIILGFTRIVERQRSGSNGQDNGQSDTQDGAGKTDGKDKRGKGQSCAKECTDTELDFRFKSGRGTCHSPDRTESPGQQD